MIAPYEPDKYALHETELHDETPTDFASLMTVMPPETSELPELHRYERTDFASLNADQPKQRRVEMPNTPADHFINFVTPCLIFFLVMSVLLFLLNVRFIYTAVHDMNLRWFAIFFVIGVVALNRLIARDGSAEAFLYAIALAGAVAFYTVFTTELYGAGSVARNFMNTNPWLALLFNMAVVVFIWWLVNRLTHECCVDENAVAGDIGLFAATGEQIKRTLRMAAAPPPKEAPIHIAGVDEPWHGISAFDPLDIEKKSAAPRQQPKTTADFSQRLPKRHPGMALFYFSVPVMIVFSLGLRVIQHMGMPAVRMGAFYMYVYTFCALVLLTLTCLRQLRAYFRMRYVAMPSSLPWIWLIFAAMMILVILWGAANLPMPDLPPIAYVDEHQVDVYNPFTLRVELKTVTPPSMSLLQQWRFADRADRAAKAVIVALLLYAIIKGLQWVVELLLVKRNSLPYWMNRLITALAWLLFKMWPALMRWALPQRRIRIQRHVALSSHYDNPLAKPNAPPMPIREHIAYAYDALRALATDVGAPPRLSMTPYEFLANYPEQLATMRQEAEDLIRLYVIAAYSTFETDQFMEDRLRKFWISFRAIRSYYVR